VTALTQTAPLASFLPNALGHIDAVDPSGAISGWCAGESAPFGPRRVTILIDGKAALTGVVCDKFRKDLLAAGVGDGHHGFSTELPRAFLIPGTHAEISLIDEISLQPVGQVLSQTWEAEAAPKPALEAHIDQITPEGMIAGWCWDRANPHRRITLNIFVDGTLAGSVLAGIYRDDLRAAGKGTGHCGFGYFLPWNLITARGEIAVTLQDDETGLPVGRRMTVQSPHIVTAEQRIDSLERQLRLLRAELQAAETRAAQAAAGQAQPELFRQVAAFFQELAEGRPAARFSSLKARLDDIADRLKLIPLSLAQDPDVTLYVLPDGSIDHLHACLQAVHRSGADLRARVVVLDLAEDHHDDATMIQAVVRNIHVARLRPGETINDVLSATTTPFLALLPAQVLIRAAWQEQLVQDLRDDPEAAVAASAFTSPTEAIALRHLRIDPRTGVFLPPPAQGEAAEGIVQVDAVDHAALLLRRETLLGAGGLDPSYSGLPAQLLDYCLRVRHLGCTISYRAQALASANADCPSLLDQSVGSDIDRLRARAAALRQGVARKSKTRAPAN
jgi:hypothetical protein